MTKFNILLSAAAVAAVVAAAGGISSASAADVSPGKTSLYDGFYIGVTGGYGTGNADVNAKLRADHRDSSSALVSEDGKSDLQGGMIGGLVGYDYNLGNGFVIGALGDLSWSGLNADVDVDPARAGVSGSDYSFDTSVDWLATVRGRVGFEMGNALIYGTGGLAFGGVDSELKVSGGGGIGSDGGTQVGWTIGAGISYMATEHIMLGAEYLYVDLGEQSYDFGRSGNADVDVDMNIIRGSISYKF
jgi:outer membrane immunogenic protein